MSTESKSIRISITIEGMAEEIPDALRTLLHGLGRWDSAEETDTNPPSPTTTQSNNWTRTSGSQSLNVGFAGHSSQWTMEKLTYLWGGIAEGARAALAEIASRADGYPKEDLYQVLGLDGRTVGGRLSSVGHAMARFGFWNKMTKTGMEWLWSFDGVHYRMKPEVAEMILQL